MGTLIRVLLLILKNLTIIIIASMMLELMLTGAITLSIGDFINEVVDSILSIPGALLNFVMCTAFQILGFIIQVIWDTIPGLSDAFSEPDPTAIFSAC